MWQARHRRAVEEKEEVRVDYRLKMASWWKSEGKLIVVKWAIMRGSSKGGWKMRWYLWV